MNETIKTLRFYCQKVLPLVYDDSLSYYELLCKVCDKLNEVITAQNGIPEYIEKKIKEYIESGDINAIIAQILANYNLNVKFPPSGLKPASGDGTADDTQAIQACIDYASQHEGMTLFFPNGSYLVSELTLHDTLSMYGQDRYNTRIVIRGGVKKAIISGTLRNLSLTGLGFDGNGDIQVNNVDIIDVSCDSCSISNCFFTDGYTLLKLNSKVQSDISNCYFESAVVESANLTGTGVRLTNSMFKSISDVKGKTFLNVGCDNSIIDNCILDKEVKDPLIISGENNVVNVMYNYPYNSKQVYGNNNVKIYRKYEESKADKKIFHGTDFVVDANLVYSTPATGDSFYDTVTMKTVNTNNLYKVMVENETTDTIPTRISEAEKNITTNTNNISANSNEITKTNIALTDFKKQTNDNFTTVNGDITNINKEIEKIKGIEGIRANRKIIIACDSIGIGTNPDGNVTGFTEIIRQKMGLTTGTNFFICGGNNFGFNTPSPAFRWLEGMKKVTTPDDNSITDIYVFGGDNDDTNILDVNNIAPILAQIEMFCDYCKTRFPNAQISIGMIGCKMNGTPYRLAAVKNAYSRCGTYGAKFIDNCNYILQDLSLFASDNIHLKQDGQNLLADYLLSVIHGGEVSVVKQYYGFDMNKTNKITPVNNTKFSCIQWMFNNIKHWNFDRLRFDLVTPAMIGEEMNIEAFTFNTGYICGDNSYNGCRFTTTGFGYFEDDQYRVITIRFNVIERKIVLSIACLDGTGYPQAKLKGIIIPAFETQQVSDMC